MPEPSHASGDTPNNTPDSITSNVYVISMPSAALRREHMRKELGAHGIAFHFFDALHGEQTLRALEQSGLSTVPNALTLGELGCLMSHVRLWQQLVQSDEETMTILEDDVFLGHDAAYWLTHADWIPSPLTHQLIKLEKHEVKVTQSRSSIAVHDRKLRLLRQKHFATGGYRIGRHAAAEVLALIKSAPIDQAVDHLLFCDYRLHRPQAVWQLNPAICVQEKCVPTAALQLGNHLEAERLAAHLKKAKPSHLARNMRFLNPSYWVGKVQKWTSPSAIGFR